MGLTIDQNVKRLLDEKGWTPYRLGKESGVSMTAIYSLKAKKRGPDAETLIKISSALGVSLDDLVRESD